ncbi:MAG: hypothetical protein JWP34_1690 [Massilia sp.]|nr:hypothetical protein [Massilia sp.]
MYTKQNVLTWLRTILVGAAISAAAVACGGGYGGGGGTGYMPPPAVTTKFLATSLVSDGTPAAPHTDSNLVNGWGVAFNPTGFVWVANNGSNTSTLYDGNGVPQTLIVATPPGTAGAASPTGIVFNGSQDFQVTQNGITGASAFIFVGETGTVSGWSPTVNRLNAVTVVDGGANGPVYKGLAIGSYLGANYLYAADFRNNAIDVFNGSFGKVTLPGGAFRDPGLPAGYAPFGIQAIGDRIYVAYAQKAAAGTDEVKGAGLGRVSVFDTSGAYIRQLVMGGALNAPWGMAMAPANFGTFSNNLLVGNFGDGKINAYDPTSGTLIGTLSRPDGTAITIDGLWGMAFGNGINAQPTNTLFFAAGPADEAHGLYGRIDMQ